MKHTALAVSSIPDGQQLGAMLVGLVQSLKNVQVISGEQAAQLVKGVKSDAWYPMSSFFSVLDEIQHTEIDLDPILFQAGVAFTKDWFAKFNGGTVFPSAKDFIRMQARNGGYSLVHQGDPDEIGWQDLLELDESAGRATVVCVTPYPREFERGVFYCGMLIAGDVDYAHVESIEEPYNCRLSKKTITIQYHLKAGKESDDALDDFLSSVSPSTPIALPEHLHEAMTWRLKSVQEQWSNDRLFYEQSSLLLSEAASRVYDLSQKLDRIAHHDELTDSLNRRAVFERTTAILALAMRHRWPVSFIMLDIDHFKSINDTWGHAAGDDTLRKVVIALRQRLRDSDLVGRIGGEEFLIVLPQTDLEGARALAESLRVAVEQCRPLVASEPQIQVTISLGIAVANSPMSDEVDKYVMQADQALYVSKRSGRNRVSIFAA